MHRLFLVCLVAGLSILFLTGQAANAKPLIVQASSYPAYYFAQRVATDSFDVRYRVPNAVDPAFWRPGDEDLIAFQQADIILLNGATYEKWLKTVTLPRSIMLDTSKGFSDQYLESEGEVHQHGKGIAHSHGGTAMTTWLDFALAAKQAESIAERFIVEAPADEAAIKERLAVLKEDLEELDDRMNAIAGAWADKELIIASHPVYQYLAKAYGFTLESVEWEWNTPLGDQETAKLKALIDKNQASWMIWESNPTKDNQARIRQLGLEILVVSPCGNRIGDKDWLQIMHNNVLMLESIVN